MRVAKDTERRSGKSASTKPASTISTLAFGPGGMLRFIAQNLPPEDWSDRLRADLQKYQPELLRYDPQRRQEPQDESEKPPKGTEAEK